MIIGRKSQSGPAKSAADMPFSAGPCSGPRSECGYPQKIMKRTGELPRGRPTLITEMVAKEGVRGGTSEPRAFTPARPAVPHVRPPASQPVMSGERHPAT